MGARLKNWLLFRIERAMMRGPLSRVAFIAFLVGLVALGAGLLVRLLSPGFDTAGDAIWWAFLRLTDSGYLGEDQDAARRTVSAIVTLFGFLLFTGSLIAILTQWLVETIGRMELGLTPIALKEHIVVLGWTSRTPAILEEMLVSEARIRRFLRARGARRLRLALLAESGDAMLLREIRERLGEHWSARRLILRNGSPLRLEHLQRVDFAHAAAILIPAADTTASNPLHADTRTIKTLMTVGGALNGAADTQKLPRLVAEIQDVRQIRPAQSLYTGPLDIIASDQVISRLIAQNVRHRGLSHIYAELLSDASGSQIYIREAPQLAGANLQALATAFTEAVLLGIVRPYEGGFRAQLNPPDDMVLQPDDRLVLIARRYEDAEPPASVPSGPQPAHRPVPSSEVAPGRRVLVLGWNHRVPSLLQELASYPKEEIRVDLVSLVPPKQRQASIAAHEVSEGRLQIRHFELDYTIPAHLKSIEPGNYNNLVLLASERLKPGAESDARTILGYLVFRDLVPTGPGTPEVLVELTDQDNVALFEQRHGEVLISPIIVSHMLARVAMRRELRAVFEELFGSGGAEIFFRPIGEYGLSPGHYTLADLQRTAEERGEIALGLRRSARELAADGGVKLNPRRDKPLRLQETDEVIVLTTYH